MVYDLHVFMGMSQSNGYGYADYNATGGSTANASASDGGMGYQTAFTFTKFRQKSSTAPSANAGTAQTYNINIALGDLKPFAAAGTTNMGFEADFGRRVIAEGLAVSPYIAKFAIAGSSVPTHWAKSPGWGGIYNDLVAYINTCIAEAGRPIDVFPIMIGETDAGTPASVTSMPSDWTTLINNLKADVPSLVNTKFIVVLVNPSTTFGDAAGMRAQQLAFAASYPNTFVVDSAGVPLHADPHYDATGQGTMGARILQATRKALYPNQSVNLAAGPTPWFQGDDPWQTAEIAPMVSQPRSYYDVRVGDLEFWLAGSYSQVVTHDVVDAAGFTALQLGGGINQLDSAFSGAVHRGMTLYYRVVTRDMLVANTDAAGNYHTVAPQIRFGAATLNFSKLFTIRGADPNNPIVSFSTGVNNASNTALNIAAGAPNVPGAMAAIFLLHNGATQSVSNIVNADLTSISIKRDGRGNPGAGTIGYAFATATIPGNTYTTTNVTFAAVNVSVGALVVVRPDSTRSNVVVLDDMTATGTGTAASAPTTTGDGAVTLDAMTVTGTGTLGAPPALSTAAKPTATDSSVLLRFNDYEDDAQPRDDAGGLNDLTSDPTGSVNGDPLLMPPTVEGTTGWARYFGADDVYGLIASDRQSGSTLLQRDVSWQAIVRWDFDTQVAQVGHIGGPYATLYQRGRTGSPAEYSSARVDLRVVNAAHRVGELRWTWQDEAGVERVQVGGHFQVSSGYMLLTATRRWESATRVVCRYYAGDQLLAEGESADGSIGGGTTAMTSIGTGMVDFAWTAPFFGWLDEMRIVPRELQPEEVEATFRRITQTQPLANRLYLDVHPPGFPMSRDPASDVQLEARVYGHALGFAIAQAENLRDNILPQRAYGGALEEWERAQALSPVAGDSVDVRRKRSVAKFRQKLGSSIPGLKAMLAELADTNPENLQFLGASNDIADSCDSLNARWAVQPSSAWSAAGTLACQPAAITPSWSGFVNRHYAQLALGGAGRGAHVLSKMTYTTPTSNATDSEVGIFVGDFAHSNYLFFGLRKAGATYALTREEYLGGAPQGLVTLAALGGVNPGPMWLHLWADDFATADAWNAATNATWHAAYSLTGPTSGYTTFASFAARARHDLAGMYVRSSVALNSGSRVDWDDVLVRAPYGDRPFHHYVYRDPGLPGRPDTLGAERTMQSVIHSFTRGHFVIARQALCDDPNTGCDWTPMGAI